MRMRINISELEHDVPVCTLQLMYIETNQELDLGLDQIVAQFKAISYY